MTEAEAPLAITALLYAHPGKRDALRAYEEAALAIAVEHGCTVLAVILPEPGAGAPDEIHVLAFPGRSALGAYRMDPRHAALSEARAAAIARTVVFEGRPLFPCYEDITVQFTSM